MNASFIALLLCACVAVAVAGHFGGFGGYGGGFGGFEGGHGYHKTVPGPSFLVKTVHHVNKLHRGAHLVGGHHGHGGYGGGYGGGFGFGGLKH
ncbi:uncharacterized protein LOC119389979 [Rhipicephalus sanguineus]|uniref:Uncharacterized protein n=1 Tax=Rhipicephalus sanguineus TaxID=34632 RepID=A0A9D4QFJ7_RHISA|nr:uncharacterized protein LOC119389979 [Rhipicephalus sanguineus]KAH7981908.1 hypothetical protein HPB52_001756 [Rhipicephalus sanguineus]